jgi:uncharacterized protein
MTPFLKFIWHIPRQILIGILKIYQWIISPIAHVIFIGGCKFQPTCSEYGVEVIKKYGVVRGIGKALWRIGRCNPWGKGGVDFP